MNHSAFYIVLVALFHVCFGQGQPCTTPDSKQGECKSVIGCPPLLALVNNPQRTPQDTDFLRKSQCGFEGNVPTVCCPQEIPECTTPEGKPGKCVNLNSCTHISNLLKPPNRVTPDVIQYIQSTRCENKEQYDVCCEIAQIKNSRKECATKLTSQPPDPSSECCGRDARNGDRIIGGKATEVDQYPWLVNIEYELNGQVRIQCGGALISGRYVLTAAHCVIGTKALRNGNPTRIRLGDYDTSKPGKDCAPSNGGGRDCTAGEVKIPIERVIPHPKYDPVRPERGNDIALIRLNRMAPFTDFIRPICLPSSDLTQSAPQNLNLTVAGWGAISTRQSFSNIKLDVSLPFVPQAKCQSIYNAPEFAGTVTIRPGQMCAGGRNGTDSCKGDSGGPLMYDNNGKFYEAVGVVSFGPLVCGVGTAPGVYTKVVEYVNWIRDTIVD